MATSLSPEVARWTGRRGSGGGLPARGLGAPLSQRGRLRWRAPPAGAIALDLPSVPVPTAISPIPAPMSDRFVHHLCRLRSHRDRPLLLRLRRAQGRLGLPHTAEGRHRRGQVLPGLRPGLADVGSAGTAPRGPHALDHRRDGAGGLLVGLLFMVSRTPPTPARPPRRTRPPRADRWRRRHAAGHQQHVARGSGSTGSTTGSCAQRSRETRPP